MIKVTPFVNTTCSSKFKEFLERKFTINMLSQVNDNKSDDIIFDGWCHEFTSNTHEFTNNDNIQLEFKSEYYIININENKYTILLPITINDFINDMQKFKIDIYWHDNIDERFEPKEYLRTEEIYDYYKDLLTKLNKSHELQ